MIVHDEIDIVHIESSGCDICSDEYTDLAFLEVLERTHTVSLLHITIDIGGRESISKEVSFELFSLMLLRREYHHLVIRIALENTLHYGVLISDTDSHEDVIDRIDCWRLREHE